MYNTTIPSANQDNSHDIFWQITALDKENCDIAFRVLLKGDIPEQHINTEETSTTWTIWIKCNPEYESIIEKAAGDYPWGKSRQFKKKTNDPCGEFDINNLPSALKDYLQPLCAENGSHPITLAMSAIVSVNAVFGPKLSIPWWGRQMLTPSIWSLCVVESGTFKTTAMEAANEYARYINDKILEKKRNRIPSQGETSFERKQNEINILTKSPLFSNRSTASALIESMSKGQQGAIYLSEYGQFLQEMKTQYNSTYKALLIDLFDGRKNWTSQTKTNGYETIESPFFSICGFAAPIWINEETNINDIRSGFLPRHLIFRPTIKKRSHKFYPDCADAKSVWSPGFNKFKTYLDTIAEHLKDKHLTYNPLKGNALDTFNMCCLELQRIQQNYDDHEKKIEPFFIRWQAAILKLAMILQLVEDHKTNEISSSAILSAASIVKAACQSTIHLLQNDLIDNYEALCNDVLYWIKERKAKTGVFPTWRDLSRTSKFKGEKKNTVTTDVIQTLVEQGHVSFDLRNSAGPKGDRRIELVVER